MSKYPLHELLQATPDAERHTIGEFLEWLLLRFNVFNVYQSGFEAPLNGIPLTITRIVGEYYGIDPDGLEAEKERMLAEIRVRNTLADIEKLGTDTT